MSHETFDAARDLEALLEQENAMLRSTDYVGAADCAPRKEALMAALNQATITAPEVFSDPGFAAAGGRLSRLIEENRELLEIAMQVQLRLVRLVANASQSDSVIYTRSGEALRDPLPRGMTFAAQA